MMVAMVIMIHHKSETTILAHSRLVLAKLQNNIFNWMAKRSTAAITHCYRALDLYYISFVDQLFRIRSMRFSRLARCRS